MILLLDTHVLLWAAYQPDRLHQATRDEFLDPANTLVFSAASIWEVAIKAAKGRADFRVDARVLRRGLIENGYEELPVSSAHGAETADLPMQHRDPFDRILLAQARVEGMTLLTADASIAAYGPPVRLIGTPG